MTTKIRFENVRKVFQARGATVTALDGSDLEEFDGTPDDVNSSEARAIFSVSTTFPWSQE